MLVQRDHDDLDRALGAMLDPHTSPTECTDLLEALQIGFITHSTAEASVFRRRLGRVDLPASVRMVVSTVIAEHHRQARTIARLAGVRPGGTAWIARVFELRALLREHAAREELLRAALFDHLSADGRLALARDYATERLRRFGFLDPPREAAAHVQACN
jgi:hypothetical protein